MRPQCWFAIAALSLAACAAQTAKPAGPPLAMRVLAEDTRLKMLPLGGALAWSRGDAGCAVDIYDFDGHNIQLVWDHTNCAKLDPGLGLLHCLVQVQRSGESYYRDNGFGEPMSLRTGADRCLQTAGKPADREVAQADAQSYLVVVGFDLKPVPPPAGSPPMIWPIGNPALAAAVQLEKDGLNAATAAADTGACFDRARRSSAGAKTVGPVMETFDACLIERGYDLTTRAH
jgi:hypothetical protein